MKTVSPLALACALLSCSLTHRSYSQDNIALNKPYTVSVAPNYEFTSKDPGNKVLTDGVYTKSTFITANTTVGWMRAKRLTIEIDLGQVSDVNGVSFNTVRATNAGINFPGDIFVFTSNDQQSYTYVGDAMNDLSDMTGPLKVRKFTLSGLNQSARYVQLVIVPSGAFIFCDEIEVLGSTGASGSNSGQSYAKANINTAVDSLIGSRMQYKKLSYQLKRVHDFNTQTTSSGDTLDLSANNGTNASLENRLHEDNLKRISLLKAQFNHNIVIDKIDTWEVLPDPYVPKGGANNYDITTETNGVQYGSFVVTNLYTTDHDVSCSLPANISDVATTQLFTVPYVESGAQYKKVADPLVPYSGAVKLAPGESRVFFFKITGIKPGQGKTQIKVQSGKFSGSLPLNVNVANVSFGNNFSLNADNWAYLTYPLLADRQDQAVADLLDHHINTMVIPPNVLPVVGSSDFSAFSDYIAKIKGFHMYFLFMDLTSKRYSDSFKTTPFLSDQWKANFLQWYDQAVKVANTAGITGSQIYVYPYDEIRNQDMQGFANFLTWLHQARPTIKTFGTLPSAASITNILPLLAMAQFHNVKYLMDMVNSTANNVWFYETEATSEALPAYTYYRLFAWQAFVYGARGIGFWDYADSTGDLELDKYDGVNATNFSVIYHGPGTEIISSRRWEAFKLGIEDFELLKRYADKNGMQQAKQLAQSVLDNPNDVTKADAVRAQLLQSL